MNQFKIISNWDTVLFECEAESRRAAIELAVACKVCLNGARLDGARLDGAILDYASFVDASFVRASFVGASFDGASLDGARFNGASLDGASFMRARLDGASFMRARLDGASFVRARLDDASFDGAILNGARFNGASIDGANLAPIRDDFWAILCAAPREVPALRKAIAEGRINGSAYEGDCACLIGTIANARRCNIDSLGVLKPNSDRPAERFFLAINKGDTPETSQFSRLALEWIDQWLTAMQEAFQSR